MSKTIIDMYYNICQSQVYTLRGWHDWKESKWVMNGASFVKLNNLKLKVEKSVNKYAPDFEKFMHDDLRPFEDIDDQINLIKFQKSDIRQVRYNLDNDSIMLDNQLFELICKINGNTEFYYIKMGQALYLYTWEEYEYKLQGLILGIATLKEEQNDA